MVAAALAVCAALVQPHAQGAKTILAWKVGSPHTGNTPDPTPPRGLSAVAHEMGVHLAVRSFPADGFAQVFAEAVARNQPPDILAFDNFGIIEGITTRRGAYAGIATDPTVKRSLLRVTGALDELLEPERGWTYLFTFSPNHDAARRLALGAPSCEGGSPVALDDGLSAVVSRVARAYLARDLSALHADADSERLVTTRPDDLPATVGVVTACAAWGNERLTFVQVAASYGTDTSTGHARVLLVLRKPASDWRWLVAARDPVSTGRFAAELPRIAGRLAPGAATRVLPPAAVVLAPADGRYPGPIRGQRFGTFTWQPSASTAVVAEIAEFAYRDDARLLLPAAARAAPRHVSAGELWTTGGEWRWRVWSVTQAGDVAFSDVRSFVH